MGNLCFAMLVGVCCVLGGCAESPRVVKMPPADEVELQKSEDVRGRVEKTVVHSREEGLLGVLSGEPEGLSHVFSDMKGVGKGISSLKKKRSTVTLVDTSVVNTGKVTASSVAVSTKRHINQIRYCYERELAIDPTLSGLLKIHFVIDGSGRVIRVVDVLNEVHPRVGSCVLKVVRGMKFAAPSVSRVVVDQSWFFGR